jgi:hypothetical protein
MAKKIKEGTSYMQEAIAETFGLMVYFIMNKLGSLFSEQNEDASESEVQRDPSRV